jgi:transcriptional regulator with XRE-family HTH domain
MTQAELALKSEMTQNNISRIESPEYGKQTISSLKKIAAALDVALVVRLVPFSQYIDWLSGTPRLDEGISPSALAVPSFEEEARDGLFEALRATIASEVGAVIGKIEASTMVLGYPVEGTIAVTPGHFYRSSQRVPAGPFSGQPTTYSLPAGLVFEAKQTRAYDAIQ